VTRAGNTLLHVPVLWNGQIYSTEFFYVTSASASKPNSGTAALGDFGASAATPRLAGNRTWAQWVGYQSVSSVAYADDLSGAKVYVGSDIGTVYCLDPTANGTTLSVFTATGNVASSPAVWEGKMYIGGCDGILKCFDDSPVVSMSLHADSNKGSTMWNNETVQIRGQLLSNPIQLEWQANLASPTTGVFNSVPSEFHPPIPNATITVDFTKPDGTSENVTCQTDKQGFFTLEKALPTTGTWGWVAYYEGIRRIGISYDAAYGEWHEISVEAAPVSQAETPAITPNPTPSEVPIATPTPTIEPTASPTTFGGTTNYIIIAAIVIVIIIVAAGAYMYTKQKKKKA
jgi:hypothetical protein